MRLEADSAAAPAFGPDLVADLRGLLPRDAPLALGFALLAFGAGPVGA